MRWGEAWVLNLLWTLVPLAWLLYYLEARRERRLRQLLDAAALERLAPGRWQTGARIKHLLWLGAVALVIVALSRPQWGSHWQEVPQRGLDLLVVLDTSNSMLATDLRPSRLQRAKLGIGDLVRRLSGDRIGLVAFAGSSFLQCPLTTDYAAFTMILDDVHAAIIPRGGTAIAQALETALRSFGEARGADRAIVLITDGEDHEGGLERAIAALKEHSVRVYVVGVGTVEGGRIPLEGQREGFLKDATGAVVTTALREESLKQIALATGGVYVRSASDDFGLERIYDQGIAALRRAETEAKLARTYEERFPWFLGTAALLLALEAALGERRRVSGEAGR